MVEFYRDGLGLAETGGFRDHDGYDGVFLEVPGSGAHLELTAGGIGKTGWSAEATDATADRRTLACIDHPSFVPSTLPMCNASVVC